LLLAPIKQTGSDRDPIYSYLRDLESDSEDMESSRLLYVAATRAEHRLHLLGCVKCEEDGTPKRPTSRSLLVRAWPVAEEFFRTPTPPALPREAPPREPITSINRLAPDFQMPPLPTPMRWTPPPEGREEEQIEFSWAGETARHVGTVVHRWLQRIADDELRGWDAKRVESLKENFSRELERRGVPPAELRVSTELVAIAMQNSLADERGRWVLGPHADARSEYRMRLRTPDGSRTLVMDRVFRDVDGTRWIIDYKTSRHEGANVDVFLDRERERYDGQLATYAALFTDSRQGLYFPLLRGWRNSRPQ
jgi:ATP-dependent exoDNAse (exonuclease V) beta subunit